MERLRFLTAGESHGPELTVIVEGIPAGLALPPEVINRELARRQQGYGSGSRMKIEKDRVVITSGLMAGETIGAPIAMRIKNRSHREWQGQQIPPFTTPRPGHVDLCGTLKYGYRDIRPALERASARETAARTAVGAVCRHFLSQFGVRVGGWVAAVGSVEARLPEINGNNFQDRVEKTENSDVRCPDPEASEQIKSAIREAKINGETLGGVIEIAAVGLPVGLGSYMHWDRKLDARLGGALLSVQAIKGVEIGSAFENARKQGTEVQDAIRMQDAELIRSTNRAGGLEGGVTNGNPLVLRAAMKPIATTLSSQPTVNLAAGEESPTQYERSDFCPVPRAVPVLESMTAFVLADALLEKLGGDSLDEIHPRFQALTQARLSEIHLDNTPHPWWPL